MITITHKEPNKKLSKYVRKISIFKSNGKIKYRQKLTPSAFTYLSYNQQDIPVSIFDCKKNQPNSRLQISGPKTMDNIFVEYNGRLSQILIEFSASGFYHLFHHTPAQLANKLSDLHNHISPQISIRLEQELNKTNNVEEEILLLEEFLINMSSNALPFIDYIENALEIIDKHHGNITVNKISEQICISERQLNRKFHQVVGISPKCYAKLFQLHYVIQLMHFNKYSSLQEIAYETEFYDPAHFSHRFKELTGFTPHEFIKSDKHIALDYFTG